MIWLLRRRVALGLTYRRQNCAASAAFSFWKSQIGFRVLGQTVSWFNCCPLLESQQHEFSLRESHPPSASPPPPPLSIFKASAHWSQVGLQTWVMWLRLTHALRHQPSVWSQQWHKHYSKHTHTHIIYWLKRHTGRQTWRCRRFETQSCKQPLSSPYVMWSLLRNWKLIHRWYEISLLTVNMSNTTTHTLACTLYPTKGMFTYFNINISAVLLLKVRKQIILRLHKSDLKRFQNKLSLTCRSHLSFFKIQEWIICLFAIKHLWSKHTFSSLVGKIVF